MTTICFLQGSSILPDPTVDRRPIAARSLRVFQVVADWLVRHRASPDAISVLGMAAGIGAGLVFAVAPGHLALWLLGAALVQMRLLANMLDGMVAVGRGVASRTGEVFNEVPDRVSDTAVLAGLGVAAQRPALGLAAALLALATAYIRTLGKALGCPSDFCGPGAKQQRMVLVTLAALWCALTPQALNQAAPDYALWVVLALTAITVVRRLWRLGAALSR